MRRVSRHCRSFQIHISAVSAAISQNRICLSPTLFQHNEETGFSSGQTLTVFLFKGTTEASIKISSFVLLRVFHYFYSEIGLISLLIIHLMSIIASDNRKQLQNTSLHLIFSKQSTSLYFQADLKHIIMATPAKEVTQKTVSWYKHTVGLWVTVQCKHNFINGMFLDVGEKKVMKQWIERHLLAKGGNYNKCKMHHAAYAFQTPNGQSC